MTSDSPSSGCSSAVSVTPANRRRFLLGLAGSWLVHSSAFSQREQATSFKLTSQLVNVYATVRDRNGALVQNLNKDDFTVLEDGRKQQLSFFSHESDLPLTVGLLVDTSPSEARMLDQEREACRSFLRTVLLPSKDQAFLVRFDSKVDLVQNLTGSLAQLDHALDQLDELSDEPHFRQRSGNTAHASSEGEDDRVDESGSTHLYDAVFLAAKQVLKDKSGRKALIVVGDGDDMGSRVSQSTAIRAAQKADITIYCIRVVDKDFGKDGQKRRVNWREGIQGVAGMAGIPGLGQMGGPGGAGPGGGGRGGGEAPSSGGPGGGGPGSGGAGQSAPNRSDGKKHLQALATETGGALYEVSKKVALGEIFAQIGRDLRSQYSLAYKPAATALPGYRTLQVSTRQKNLQVEARAGYYADSSE